MGVEGVSGLAVAATAGGALLLWSGLKGAKVSTALGSVISGQQPSGTNANQITAAYDASQATTTATVSGGSATGQAIATDAMKYVGQGYIYGGPSQPGKWDCSSFVSYVLGHDLGMSIPGGSWASVTNNGASHGPASGSYMLFGTGITQSQVAAGDLIATTDHIGIAISPTQMVSAQDEALGVGVAGFPGGFPGGTPVYRRVAS